MLKSHGERRARWLKTTAAVLVNRASEIHLPIYQSVRPWQAACNIAVNATQRVAKREDKKMKTKLCALALLAGGCLFAQPRVYAGVGYGYAAPAPVVVRYAPPAPMVSYATPMPAPGYAWVGGYWYPNAGRYAWHAGYWARPAFAGARWYGPRYVGGRYYGGHWRR